MSGVVVVVVLVLVVKVVVVVVVVVVVCVCVCMCVQHLATFKQKTSPPSSASSPVDQLLIVYL